MARPIKHFTYTMIFGVLLTVVALPAQAAPNAVNDPSFEKNNSSWAGDTDFNYGLYTPDGDWVLGLDESSSVSQILRVPNDGKRSSLTFYYESPSITSDDMSFTIQLVDKKNNTKYINEPYTVSTSTAWNRWHQVRITVPKKAKGKRVELRIKQTQGSGNYDLVELRKAAYPTARVYVGGNTEEYDWMEPEPLTGAKVWVKDANNHRVSIRPEGADQAQRDRSILTDSDGEVEFSIIDVSPDDEKYSVCTSYENKKACNPLQALMGSTDNYTSFDLQ